METIATMLVVLVAMGLGQATGANSVDVITAPAKDDGRGVGCCDGDGLGRGEGAVGRGEGLSDIDGASDGERVLAMTASTCTEESSTTLASDGDPASCVARLLERDALTDNARSVTD